MPLPKDTIAGIFHYIGQHQPELYHDAIQRGLNAGGAKSFPFVSLAAAYLDGKPIERVLVGADVRMLFVPAAGPVAALLPDLGEDE